MPEFEDFAFVVRLVANTLGSNGSSSMVRAAGSRTARCNLSFQTSLRLTNQPVSCDGNFVPRLLFVVAAWRSVWRGSQFAI